MATKLNLYNAALVEIGERILSSLTESREPRRVLDQVWDAGFVDEILSLGQWNFAARTVQVDYDTGITPPFGYNRGFSKPTDCIRTMGLSEDEYFAIPLNEYADETGYWYAEPDTIYVKYVSNDESFGGNLASWPANFRRFAEVQLASRINTRLTQNEEKTNGLIRLGKKLLTEAKSTDAMDEPTNFPPRGGWATARYGRRNNRERRGS